MIFKKKHILGDVTKPWSNLIFTTENINQGWTLGIWYILRYLASTDKKYKFNLIKQINLIKKKS